MERIEKPINIEKIELTFPGQEDMVKVGHALKDVFDSSDISIGKDGEDTLILTKAQKTLSFMNLPYSLHVEKEDFLNLPRIDGGKGSDKLVIFIGDKRIVISGFIFKTIFYIPC